MDSVVKRTLLHVINLHSYQSYVTITVIVIVVFISII